MAFWDKTSKCVVLSVVVLCPHQQGCPRAAYHVSVTPEEQCQGQYVTAPQGSVFVSLHAMDRTAAAADRVSLFGMCVFICRLKRNVKVLC